MSEANRYLGNTTELGSAPLFAAEYGYTALRFYLLEVARELIPEGRIKVCWRYPLPERKCIEIIYSQELNRARSSGTMKCGSAWVCPACMMYIQERRRQELKAALDRSKDDYFSVLATYTFSHKAGMSLANMLHQMQIAFRRVKTGRMWQTIKDEYMLVGSVKATEITYGVNGWHPHFHELILVKKEMIENYHSGNTDEFAMSLQNQMSVRWIDGLAKEGLTGRDKIALDVRSSKADVAEYVAKWGRLPPHVDLNVESDEVSYSVSKTPRNGNFGVLDILYNAAEDRKYKDLFREYYRATKGKSQLQWSRGLKGLLDIEIIRDEIAAQGIETPTDVLLAKIEIELWKHISKTGRMAQVMTYANEGDANRLKWLLSVINDEYQDAWTPVPGSEWQLGH